MGMGGKNRTDVFDMKQTVQFGVCLGAEALMGLKIKDKLAWPPKQVDGDDTVERCPDLDYRRLNAEIDLNDLGRSGGRTRRRRSTRSIRRS